VGAAALGAVFAAKAGLHAGEGGLALTAAARADVIDAVQLVFLAAAPLAALGLLAVLALPELPLQTAPARPAPDREGARSSAAVAAPQRG
jgi:hypothetical protein